MMSKSGQVRSLAPLIIQLRAEQDRGRYAAYICAASDPDGTKLEFSTLHMSGVLNEKVIEAWKAFTMESLKLVIADYFAIHFPDEPIPGMNVYAKKPAAPTMTAADVTRQIEKMIDGIDAVPDGGIDEHIAQYLKRLDNQHHGN